MNIHEYAKTRSTSKRFHNWLEEEPQVMCDWAMWADGKTVEERYEYLLVVYTEENKCSK